MQNNTIVNDKTLNPLRTSSGLRVVVNIAIAVTWLILLMATPSLFTHTSTEAIILKKYSLEYTIGLAIYSLAIFALPIFFLLNEDVLKFFLRKCQETVSNPEIYARYISFCLATFIILFFLSQTFTWTYDTSLQISLLIQGTWIVILPVFIHWGIMGWSLKYFSVRQVYEWLAGNVNMWTGPIIVITVILFSALLGYNGSSREQQLFFLLIPAIGVIMLFWHRPLLGIVALLFTIVIPLNGPSGFNATIALVAFLFGLWIVEMIFIQRKVTLVSSITIKPLTILVIVACLSFGFGQLPWYTFAQSAPLGAQLGGLAIYILSAAAFLLIAHKIQDIRWLQIIVWTFLAIGAVYIIARIFSIGVIDIYGGVVNGSLFWTWMLILSFSQAIFNHKIHPGWRIVLISLAILTFYIANVEQADWKSGWVPPLAGIAAMMGIRYWRVLLVAAPFTLSPISYFIAKTIASDSYSWGTRVDAWLIVIEITKASPIFGLGFANYNWFTPLFPIRGYAVRFNSHSQYVDLFAQTGIVGFVAFIYFFIVVGWLGWKLLNRVPDGFPRAYVYGALGGVVATLVSAALGDWVLPFFYNVGLSGFRASVLSWIFLGGLVILEQLYKEPKQEVVP